jgi:hypothetical protein
MNPQMFTELTAYQLAMLLHSHFYTECIVLLDARVATRGLPVSTDQGKGGKTQKLVAFGRIMDRPAYQSLSRSRDGIMYLSTVFTQENGPHIPMSFRPERTDEDRRPVKQSLFYQYFLLQGNGDPADPEAIIGPPYPWTFDHYRRLDVATRNTQ